MFLLRIVLIPAHFLVIAAMTSLGCQERTTNFTISTPAKGQNLSPIVAMIGSKTIRMADLWPALIEIGGKTVMQEILLKTALESLLKERSLTITQKAIDAERLLLSSTTPNMDQQVIDEILHDKGYGENRVEQLLWRNAALRILIAQDVVITEDSVKRMYSIIHGSTYPVKIIVVTTLEEANDLRSELAAGASFSDLAIEHSIDSSALQGGVVQPISIADPTWPAPIREAIPNLSIGEVSDPIFIGDRWIIITSTGVAIQSNVDFADVEKQMQHLATLAQERFLMENLAITLQQQFDPILFDVDLKRILGSD